jgi:ubiquinone/menaquinone biosynthesis C-methylase UbiE
LNYWDELMGTDEGAANYMFSYGEGPGYDTRMMLSDLINDGESVLDVGCGPGWNYDHFGEFGPKVDYTGMDYSERFIKVAKERQPEGKFFVGDARKLPPVAEAWDVVIIQDCLEHTNGYETPIKEALRVAKRRIIVSFWHLTEDDDHINDDGNDGWGAWYSRPKWEEFLNTLGYVWHHIDLEPPAKTHKWDFYIIDKEGK